MPRSVFVATLLAVLFSASVFSGPREDVNAVAKLIDDHYFDPKRAATIAADLRKDAQAGTYDRYTDHNDLANELTAYLRKLDGHFKVSWNPALAGVPPRVRGPGPGPGVGPGRGPRGPRDLQEQRTNYGFRRIERLSGNVGYIELNYVADIDFEDANSLARAAADAALELVQGADAVILDLRDNGGGAPSMVGYLVSAFVKNEADVYNTFYSREGTESERPAQTYARPMLEVPLFVLTSARTGSAAEAIAFTLQSCGRAQVVGDASGGAANPGGPFSTPNGLTIFISTGSPRNPINGRNWEGTGVRPDVEVSAPLALQRAQMLALEKMLVSAANKSDRTDALWTLEAQKTLEKPYKVKRLHGYGGIYGPYTLVDKQGKLLMTLGRRLPQTLVPLQEDVFFIEGEPTRRVIFERTKHNGVTMVLRSSNGDERRVSRAVQQ